MDHDHPILYSFRRCPYAMRARMGLVVNNIQCEIREIILRDKPAHMLELSPKGTVPVLWLPTVVTVGRNTEQPRQSKVIDESLGVMDWAYGDEAVCDRDLIHINDTHFKVALDRYKYPVRYDDVDDPLVYRAQGLTFLERLNDILLDQSHLNGNEADMTDLAIFPFVRQFSNVEPDWFYSLPLPAMHKWLDHHLSSPLFTSIMHKYDLWHDCKDPIFLL